MVAQPRHRHQHQRQQQLDADDLHDKRYVENNNIANPGIYTARAPQDLSDAR